MDCNPAPGSGASLLTGRKFVSCVPLAEAGLQVELEYIYIYIYIYIVYYVLLLYIIYINFNI